MINKWRGQLGEKQGQALKELLICQTLANCFGVKKVEINSTF
jgi:hypothetical protein